MTIVASINNDIIIPTVAGETYQGLGGDDTYILTNSLQAGDAITIDDTQGSDRIQLVDGLAIASTTVYQDAVQLVLTSGAIVNILSAGNFTFEPGGNATSGDTGTDRTFAEFVVEDLGATVPAAGADPVTGGAATIGESAAPTFELTQDATAGQVDEGSTVTYTVTASENLAADTTFTYEISSTEASAADFSTATSGTVTIPAGSNTATFQVTPVAGDGAEFSEDFTVTLSDSSGAVVDTLDSVIIDTSTADTTAPVVDAAQSFNYDENQTLSTAVLGTVTASDNAGGTGVTGFAITGGNEDGFFAINANGELTLTDDGLAAASNDFETAPNSFGLMVTATDGAGNTSAAVGVTLEIDDVDDVSPAFSSAVINGSTATVSFDEALSETSPTPAITDFKVTLKGASGEIAVNSVTVTGSTVALILGRAPAAGETFQIAYTAGSNPLEDAAGNDVASFSGKDLTVDATAPVVTADQAFTYQEGAYDDTNDIVGTVAATDDTSVTAFAITSGNDSGFFAIDSTGKITLTTAGLEATAASNDFETTPNSFSLNIQATDGAGNTSAIESVTVTVTNDTADDPAVGTNFTLTDFGTTGSYDNLMGTTGSDTYLAGPGTAETGDVINDLGGASDRLNIQEDGGGETHSPTLNGIEQLWLHNEGAAANIQTFSGANSTGLMEVWADRIQDTDGGTDGDAGVTFNNISKSVQLGVYGGTSTAANRTDVIFTLNDVTGSADEATLVLDQSAVKDVTIAGVETLNVETQGASNKIDGTLTAVNATKLVFTGDQNATIDAIDVKAANYEVDATGMTAGLTITLEDTAVNETFKGGGGDDSLYTAGANFAAGDSFDGGAGTNTIGISTKDKITAATGALIKNFQVFDAKGASGATANDYDMDLITGGGTSSTITSLKVSAALGGATMISNLFENAAGVADVAIKATTGAALTITQKGADGAGSVSDVLDVDLTGVADITVTALTVDKVETINIVSNETVGKTAGHTLTDGTFAAATTLTFSGDEQLTVNGLTGSVNVALIDASNMTDKLIFGAAADMTSTQEILVKGGSANDTLFINETNQLTGSTVQGNGGADLITITNVAAKNSIVKFVAQSDSTATSYDELVGFENADVTDGAVTSADTINISAFGFTGTQQNVVAVTAKVTMAGAQAAGTETFSISAANASNFFDDAGIDRGVAYADSGTDTWIFLDVNKDGDWDASTDSVFLVGAVSDAMAAGDFVFV